MARIKQTAAATLQRLIGDSVPGAVQPIKKKAKRHTKPGKKAEREIRTLQSTTELIIPKKSFERLIREILQDFMTDLRLVKDVCPILQEASESFLIKIFEDAQKIAKNAKRKTVMVQDFWLARDLNQKDK